MYSGVPQRVLHSAWDLLYPKSQTLMHARPSPSVVSSTLSSCRRRYVRHKHDDGCDE